MGCDLSLLLKMKTNTDVGMTYSQLTNVKYLRKTNTALVITHSQLPTVRYLRT